MPTFPERDAIVDMIRSGVAPPASMNRSLHAAEQEFGCAFPSAEAIELIARWVRPTRVLVELGAGAAVWSATIAKALPSLYVIATDIRPMNWLRNWHEICACDAQTAMTKFPDADLLAVYPLQFIADAIVKMSVGQLLFWRGPTESQQPQYFPGNFCSLLREIDQAPCEPAGGHYDAKLVVFERIG
jgi:hypothetical protein